MLGLMSLDFALSEQKLVESMTTHSSEKRLSMINGQTNKLSLIIMKRYIPDHIEGAIKGSENAKDFLNVIGQKFQESDKAKIDSLIDSLSTIRLQHGSLISRTTCVNIQIEYKRLL
ncbi:hypothetical protein HAX54_009988, partial [Datura stramonium]|nr:hypothetical protein [Datura stramonium]